MKALLSSSIRCQHKLLIGGKKEPQIQESACRQQYNLTEKIKYIPPPSFFPEK